MLVSALGLHGVQEVPPGSDVEPLGQVVQAAEPDVLYVPCMHKM